MKYLLDSNTCIRYINGSSESVARRLDGILSSQVVVCSVVKAELFFGALRSNNPSKTLAGQKQFFNLFVSLPFDDAGSVHYGQIRAD